MNNAKLNNLRQVREVANESCEGIEDKSTEEAGYKDNFLGHTELGPHGIKRSNTFTFKTLAQAVVSQIRKTNPNNLGNSTKNAHSEALE
jgi:hypothetical protein